MCAEIPNRRTCCLRSLHFSHIRIPIPFHPKNKIRYYFIYYQNQQNFDISIFHVNFCITGSFDRIWYTLKTSDALRPTKNNFLIKIKISVYFWGLGIWVSSTSFQENNIERVPYISEKLGFWWSSLQKMTSVGLFGASDNQIIRIRMFFDRIWINHVEF